jgi:hypothetical protein
MKLFHRSEDQSAPAAPATEPAARRLGGISPIAHDDDERPSAQDRGYGQTIFTREPVPLPRVLTGRKRRRSE